MADLNIPNLNKKSDKYIFKRKLSLRRKSKRLLFIESALMLISCLLLVYINYLIPNKYILLKDVPKNLDKSFSLIIDLFSYLYEVSLVFFILITYVISLILLIGAIYRLFRIARRKTKLISYK